MIFLTVGSQLPFDRLTKAVDEWAFKNRHIEIFGQIGFSNYKPKNFNYTATLDPFEYKQKFEMSDLLVSHVGMGTIITSLEAGKPLLVMPRRKDLNEVRNDHQLSTIKFLKTYSLINIANNENELIEKLDYITSHAENISFYPEDMTVSTNLIDKVTKFIENE